jgi:hypothetical protein
MPCQSFLARPQTVESLPHAFDAMALAQTVETVSPHSMPARQLVESLSFSHLAALIQIGDAAQRMSY